MTFLDKFFGKKIAEQSIERGERVVYEAPPEEVIAPGEKTPEEWTSELERLSIDNVVLASQRQALQEQSELTPEEQKFIQPVVEEVETLKGFLGGIKEKAEKLAKNKIALAVGVIAMTLMASRDASAGSNSFKISDIIKAGESMINTANKEDSRRQQELQRTEREIIQRGRQLQIEQERHARDVAIQQIRSAEAIEKARIQKEERIAVEQEKRLREEATQKLRSHEAISREEIKERRDTSTELIKSKAMETKERRDVLVEATKSKGEKSITYQRGNEVIRIDVKQAQAEADKLTADNQKMKAEIENLKLQIKKQQLEAQIKNVSK